MTPGTHEHSDDIAYPSSIGFVLIHVGCFAAIWTGLTWRAAVLAIVLYLVRIFAIGAGYHRYFAHRAFRTVATLSVLSGVPGADLGAARRPVVGRQAPSAP